jgi:hypothetical protein
MRAAILLCGQMRCFEDRDVLDSLHQFFRLFDTCDVFVSTWDKKGVSYNHGYIQHRADENAVVDGAALKRAYGDWLRAARIHDSDIWDAGLQGIHRQIVEEGFEWQGMKIKGTSIPQLYTLWDANRMRKEYERATGARYDLVIRCRPDVRFAEEAFQRRWFESIHPQAIYAINCPRTGAFFPHRIYDIFFYGSGMAMDAVCDAYHQVDALVAHPFENGLHARDVCRMLYVQANQQHGLSVVDVDSELCVVKR